MQNQEKEYWSNLIIDYLTGTITEEAHAQLSGYRKASIDNDLHFLEMQKLWHALSLSGRNEKFDEMRAYHLFKERVLAENSFRLPAKQPHRIFRRIASYAAIILPFMVFSYYTYRYFATEPIQNDVVQAPFLSEVSVPNGSKTQMKLQDGTMLWLNAGSKIQYDADFGKTHRTIAMSGEVYLEVVKDESRPFIIETGGVKVKVLGTSFNVKAYDENNEVTVSLLQGAIEMATGNDSIFTLSPEDVACYNKATGLTEVSQNATEHALNWIENKLVFNGETFEQIVQTLERSFNVEINIHNTQINTRRFAGDFVNNETISQIFSVMSVNGKFRYKIEGKVIDIY